MKLEESADGKIEYIPMTLEDAKEGLETLRVAFFPDENVSIACDVNVSPAACRELEALSIDAAEDGVSLIARDKETKEVVGVSYNKLQVKEKPGEQSYFEKYRDTKCKEKASIALLNLMIYVDSQIDVFAPYNADCCLEIMFLAIKPKFRRRAIGTDLIKNTLALGRSLEETHQRKKPQISSAICTHLGTFKICQNLEFDELYRVKWSDVNYEGVAYDKKINTTAPICMNLMAIRL